MARKRPIEDPPSASSSEDEEEDESSQGNSSAEGDDEPQNDAIEEDEEEEEEEQDEEAGDQEKTPLKTQKSDSDNVGSDSESDSDKSLPSPNASDFTIKPIVSKPNKSAPKSNPKPKPIALESSSKQRRTAASASNGGGGGGSVKTPGTARLWSEADEIAILKGMIEYKSKKGSDPYADSSGFHDFIKQSIQADVSKYQLSEKIRRLKKKYKTNSEKCQNGNDPVFSKPHDHKSFELSKKIWGNETNEKSNKRQKTMKTLTSKDEGESEFNGAITLGLPCFVKDKEVNADVSTHVSSGSEEEKVDFWKDYPCLKESFETGKWGLAGGFLMELLEKNDGEIGREKLREMERVWRELKTKQLELYLKRLELVQEMAQAALDVVKGSEI
ncbi:STOREKEEPER protein-like [Durio zibethinus]|uniref:STOREKEEPER protein-like n=1 Tax=Durio zibethinus TaxID=66656 RepID=A0A6P5XDB4_DURZI|nr:STOREKEEPER protein-like [Durio zibethinus]